MTRLEEQNYFQERALEALNEALIRQQAQVDALQQGLAAAEEKLLALRGLLEQGGEIAPPPHSNPELY